MNSQARSIEVTGASVGSAIETGLAQLDLTREDVQVEVVREASRGVLGIGAREAIVRLTEILPEVQVDIEPEMPGPAAPAGTEPGFETLVAGQVAAAAEQTVEEAPEAAKAHLTQEETLSLAKGILTEMLDKMQVQAEIETKTIGSVDPGEDPALVLDLQGKDLGFLIGRKGETLAAIQHLLRLMVNKTTQQRSNLIVDVEQYKIRRERALKKLALRIADQATRHNRRIALEPMSPYERRIIHMTLRNHPTVTTESVGEDDRRKVTILPRRQES